ncbi:MAG: hypothetical protein M1515_01245 [Candidatus Thermoplasmatota archaeon]|nr:hypothetical protein [Candidatus Thermoplasmatota archaeon]
MDRWSFYRLQNFVEYKTKLCGIPLTYVEAQKHIARVFKVQKHRN